MADNSNTTSINDTYDLASKSVFIDDDMAINRRPTLHGEGDPITMNPSPAIVSSEPAGAESLAYSAAQGVEIHTGATLDAAAAVVPETSIPAPVVTHIYDDAGNMHDVGYGGTSHSAYPTIEGTAQPGSLVTINDGYKVLGTARADGDGHWTFTPVYPLADSIHFLIVSSETGQTNGFNFFVDTQAAPPVITHVYDDAGNMHDVGYGGTSHSAYPIIEGTAQPGGLVTINDGYKVLGTVRADGDGHWTFTPTSPLADSIHFLIVSSETGQANGINFFVDTHSSASVTHAAEVNAAADDAQPAPAISAVIDQAGTVQGYLSSGETTDESHPHIAGTATPNSLVTVMDGDVVLGTAQTNSDGFWQWTGELSEGRHSLSIVSASGSASAPFELNVVHGDYIHPEPIINGVIVSNDGPYEINQLLTGGTTHDDHPTFTGTGAPNSFVTIHEGNETVGTVYVDGRGVWSWTPDGTLSEGTHSFIAVTNDGALSSAPFEVTIEGNQAAHSPSEGLSLNDVLGGGEGELFAADHSHDNAQLSLHDVAATAMDSSALHGPSVVSHDTTSLGANLVLPHEQMHAVI